MREPGTLDAGYSWVTAPKRRQRRRRAAALSGLSGSNISFRIERSVYEAWRATVIRLMSGSIARGAAGQPSCLRRRRPRDVRPRGRGARSCHPVSVHGMIVDAVGRHHGRTS